MLSVASHLQSCLELVGPLEPLEVVLADAVGCTLAEDVLAPFDRPVADCAGLDGYAVNAADIATAGPQNPVNLEVLTEILAGDIQPLRLVPGTAIKIASGAPLPTGANAVVPIEQTDHGEARVEIRTASAQGENLRHRATDVKSGSVVLAAGTRIGARQIALLAGVGRGRVNVRPRPRAVVISIGNELVEPGQQAAPGQVFDANGHALVTAIKDAGADAYRVSAVPDDRAALRETLEDQLVRADLIITTGGLSYGSGDTVKDVLAPLGTMRFDAVAMWPGRQLGSGYVGVAEFDHGVPLFALPGDPIAAQVAYEVFVRPALRKMAGWVDLFRPSVQAEVTKSWYSPSGRREFVRVLLSGSPGEGYKAEPQGSPQALLLSALATANALAVVPEDVSNVRAGDLLHCMVLDG